MTTRLKKAATQEFGVLALFAAKRSAPPCSRPPRRRRERAKKPVSAFSAPQCPMSATRWQSVSWLEISRSRATMRLNESRFLTQLF
jgi:hypothetical protein